MNACSARDARRRVAIFAFDFEIDEVPEFIDSGKGVIPGLELFAEFGDGGDDSGNDDFRGDQLTEGQLLIDDKPTTDGEKSGAGDDFEHKQAADLSHEDFEVETAGVEVGAGEVISATGGELVTARAFEEPRATGDLFQPTDHAVFANGFCDAGGNRTAAEDKNDERKDRQEHKAEGEEEGVIEPENDHADHGTENEIDACEEE